MHAITAEVSLCVQQPYMCNLVMPRKYFFVTIHYLRLFHSFCLLFHKDRSAQGEILLGISHTAVRAVWCFSPCLDDGALGVLMLALLSSKIYNNLLPPPITTWVRMAWAMCLWFMCFYLLLDSQGSGDGSNSESITNILLYNQREHERHINLRKLGTILRCEISLPDKIEII